MDKLKFYIDGAWVDPVTPRAHDVINPATEEAVARISLGSKADVDKAVAAARRAFASYSQTSKEERVNLLKRIVTIMDARKEDLGRAISQSMGAPMWLAVGVQAPSGTGHFKEMVKALDKYDFEHPLNANTRILREPVGVVGMITPWNWPLNQIGCKVAPALAAGCTMVLKPSELAPLDALLLAEILHEAGVPKGVFNLVNGDGPGVGAAISEHPDIDMVSFTGSTRAGIQVSKAAADTVKRVALELGGKSPNILLDDADYAAAVKGGLLNLVTNSGQSCNAPSRMLAPRKDYEKVIEIAAAVAQKIKVMAPDEASPGALGPLANSNQFAKVQGLIQKGIEEGGRVVAGGVGRPEGLNRGYFVRPTVFADVTPEMTIAREEIFGPVLAIIPYDDEEDAIRIANDTPYGLSAYVTSGSLERARKVAKRLRAGNVHLNGAQMDRAAPFGGYKQSGNGREWGVFGLEEFLEVKAAIGWGEQT